MPEHVGDILHKYGIPAQITDTSGIDDYRPGTLTVLANKKYLPFVSPHMNAIILTNAELLELVKTIPGNQYIVVPHPMSAFLAVHNALHPNTHLPGESRDAIHPTAIISPGAMISPGAKVHAYAVIGEGVSIGKGTLVGPHAVIADGSRIGRHCRIGPHASIGGEGFRIVEDEEGIAKRLAHMGGVEIADEVHIGSCSTVNRGTFRPTIIESGVKIDDHVHVGHNARIGPQSVLCACTCIGGSADIGAHCWLGIGTTVGDGAVLGAHVRADMNSVIAGTVGEGLHVAGFYAREKGSWMMKEKEERERFARRSGTQ